MNHSLYRCAYAYNVHNYDAQQHTAGQIISPLTLQTITIAQCCLLEGRGLHQLDQKEAIRLNCLDACLWTSTVPSNRFTKSQPLPFFCFGCLHSSLHRPRTIIREVDVAALQTRCGWSITTGNRCKTHHLSTWDTKQDTCTCTHAYIQYTYT